MSASLAETASPTWVDLSYRMAYQAAYRLMRVYWAVRRPDTHGALVALWSGDQILLIKNSYVPYHSLPGGYVRSSETGRDAAIRELREEVGIDAVANQLELVFDETNPWEGKRDHVEIFALEVHERTRPQVDQREVVDAQWYGIEQALSLDLFPPVRRVIEARRQKLG